MDNKTYIIPRFKTAIRALMHLADGMEERMNEYIGDLTDKDIDILKRKIEDLRDAAKFLADGTEE